MAWFPGEAVAAAWNTLGDVRVFTGISAEALVGIEEQTGDMRNSIRALSLISAPAVAVAINATEVTTAPGPPAVRRPATLVEKTGLALMWRIARRLAWRASGEAWDAYRDVDPLDPVAPAPLALAVPAAAQPAAATAPVPGGRRIRANQVIDQGDEAEFAPATQVQLDGWYATYLMLNRGPPSESREPNEDQLVALYNRVMIGRRSPYVDLAIWCPYARRAIRASKFRAWIPTGSGEYICRELPGPENFKQWTAGWRVFEVAALMVAALTPTALALYFEHIKQLVQLFPDFNF